MSRLPNYTTEVSASPKSDENHLDNGNGKIIEAAASSQGSASGSSQSHVQRAEAMADRLAQWAAVCGRKMVSLTSHVREALEDVWAEAQSIRRQK